jgi:hypothetical protein
VIDVGRQILTVRAQVTGSVLCTVAGKNISRPEIQGSATKV